MTENKDVSLEGLEFDGETVLCRVCGDKASGFHYGVHACEGCKGFFRRSIQQKIQYRPCLKNQQCNIMRVNRNRCQYCRLKKCIAVGMSRDAVRFGRVPKKEKAKIMEVMQKAFTQSQNSALNILLENETRFHELIIDAHMNTSGYTHAKIDQFCQEAWEQAQYVNCPAHKACPLNPIPESQSDKKWDDFSEFFTPAIRNVVDFAKSIPGFDLLCQEDQVTLLKAGTFEVLLVQLAPLFNSSMDTMAFTNGKLFKRTGSANGSNAGFLLDSMFDFSERLNLLKLSDSETALFSALVIIASDRPGLRNPDQVDKIQDKIRQGLQAQMMANHPEDSAAFAKLLLKIPDLRTLNTLHSEKLLGLSVQPGASTSQEVNGYTQQPPTTANGIMSGMHGIGVCPIQRTPAISQQPVIPVPAHPTPMDTNNNSHIVLQTSWGTFTRHNPSFTAMAPQPASESSTANSIKRQANPLVAHLLTTDVDMMPDDRNSATLSSLGKSDAVTSSAPTTAQNGTATVSNAIATNMNHPGSSAAMATPNGKATNDLQDQLERISPASSQSGSGLPKMLVTGPPGVAVDTWLQQQDGSTPVRVVAANPVPEPEGPVMQWRRRSHSGYETPSEASRSNSPVNIIDVDVNPYGSLPPSNRSSPHLYDPWGEPGSLPGEPVRKRAYSAAAEILRRGHPKHNNNGQSQPNSQRTSPSREFVVPGSDMPEAYPEPPRKRAYSYGAVSKVNRLWQKKKENFLNVCSAFSSTESISASFSQKLSVANEKEEILINGAKGQSSEGQSAMPDGQGHRPGAMMPTLKNALSKPPLDSNSLMLGQRMMGIINESLEKNTMPNAGSSDSESMSPGVETVKDDPPSKGVPENALNSLQQMVHGKQMDTDPPAKMSPAQSNNMSVDMETRPRSNTIGQGHPFIPASQQMAPNMAEQGRRNSLPVHIPRDGTFERFAVPTARVPPQEQNHVNISDSNNSRVMNDCTNSGTSNSDTLIRTGSGGMAAPLLKEKILQRVASREALNQLGKTAPDGEIPSKEKSNEHAVNEMMNSALKASLQQQNGLGTLRYPLSSPFYSPLVQQQMMYPYGHFAAQHVVQMQHMQMAALQMQAQLQQQQQQQQQQQGLILADRPEGGSPLNLKKEKS